MKPKDQWKVWNLIDLKAEMKNDYLDLLSVKKPENISIVFYDNLPNPIVSWATERSEEFVGCTGDDSFSRVLSMGKVPVYHALGHKIGLKNSVVNGIENQGHETLAKIFRNFIDQENAKIEKSRNFSV